MGTKKTVFVIYYSTYGHIEKMAHSVCKGLKKSGVNVKLFRIAETLSPEVLEKMHVPKKENSVPVITPDKLKEADGYLFGFPTRFGIIPEQVKTFFDSCGQLWMNSALSNKFVGTFFSTGSIGQGQESTAFFCIPFFAHMGMIFVPIGTKHKILGENSIVHGGSAYGAGCIAIANEPNSLELELAEFQGQDFGKIVSKYNVDSHSKKSSRICNIV
ncbi:unnamed protein product [Brachionus calyciflorus]|uniref:Flavodoxin-like domain-containing protein n=1 Tax=Brachionus calyciflorus TaxID=104777 RepID=A0A813N224_9BILA|nr:unnamed protein product [Brachionus calyciflorus]